jgi:glycerophosphoryl diester phosphodiesterase
MPGQLILGHRGAPFDAPENTMRSFKLAIEQGADGVELDVQISSDGVAVVIHDQTLERTTHGRGRVDAHSWAELSEIRGAGEPIPSLEQAAEWARATGAWLNVEMKAAGLEAVAIATLRAAGILDRVIFSSFDPGIVYRIGSHAPDSRRFLLMEDWAPTAVDDVRRCGAQGICLKDDAATADAIRALREADLPLVVWTVDDPRRMEELLRLNVMAIITNRPAIAGGSPLATTATGSR